MRGPRWLGEEQLHTYHLDLHQGFVAIIEQVAGLAAVDADDAEQQLATQAEGEGGIIGGDDGIHAVLQVVLQNLDLGDLALLVGREPCLGQGAGGTQQRARPEHGGDGRERAKLCAGNAQWVREKKKAIQQRRPAIGLMRRGARWADDSDATRRDGWGGCSVVGVLW